MGNLEREEWTLRLHFSTALEDGSHGEILAWRRSERRSEGSHEENSGESVVGRVIRSESSFLVSLLHYEPGGLVETKRDRCRFRYQSFCFPVQFWRCVIYNHSYLASIMAG
nr:hypothetical protein CFP56_29910 [Quercus suber]